MHGCNASEACRHPDMKNIAALATALFLLALSSEAHNGGGCCTMSGNYLGIMPQYQKNFVGIRYNTRSYTMPAMYMDHGQGPMLHNPEATDRFRSMELWDRFYPTRRMQVMATLPYVSNFSIAGSTSAQAAGIGDATLLANYAVAATSDSALWRTKHRLQLGGGVKLPTGRYRNTENGSLLATPANFNPGTGTLDLLATVQYTIRLNQWGLNTDFFYKFNSENKDGYRFGNQYNSSCQLFYWQKIKQVSVLPAAGIYHEKALANALHGHTLAKPDGSTTFSTCGLDIYYKNAAIGGTWQRPFQRQHAEGGMIKNDRAAMHLTVMF